MHAEYEIFAHTHTVCVYVLQVDLLYLRQASNIISPELHTVLKLYWITIAIHVMQWINEIYQLFMTVSKFCYLRKWVHRLQNCHNTCTHTNQTCCYIWRILNIDVYPEYIRLRLQSPSRLEINNYILKKVNNHIIQGHNRDGYL